MIDIKRILCPIDFSEYSEHALRHAMQLAVWYGARLHVLHIMPPLPPSAASALAASCRDMTARNLQAAVERQRVPGADVTTEVLESADPAARIIELADAMDADLVVTGSHGRSGAQRVLLGSVVEAMLHRCSRPILVLPRQLGARRATPPAGFDRIVCAVDFSAPSLNALANALAIAEESDATLTLLHVIAVPPELGAPHSESPGFSVDQIRAEAERQCLRQLRTLVPEHARGYCTIETAVLEGGVSRQLLQMAEARQADLIVIGVHGRNALDVAFFGSNSHDVIRHAHCPVLVVPAAHHRSTLRAVS